MAPYRVLQLITRADWGGAQRHVYDLAVGLDPERFHVAVACAPDGPLVDKLQAKGIQVISVPEFRRELSFTEDWSALKAIEEIIRTTGANLLHSHSSKAGFLGRWAAHRAKIPVLYTAHGFAFGGQAVSLPTRLLYLGAEWYAGRVWSDFIITVSDADRRLALRWGVAPPDRLVTIHNGIDPTIYEQIQEPPTTRYPPVIGVLSRLVSGKGLEDLLRAAALLSRRGNYRFVIGGDGPLQQALDRQAKELGIASCVEFLGFVSDPVAYWRNIDVFVLPSYKEGLPYNILEALAAGRPVVATAVGGIPEVITDGENGRLVPVGDEKALADALEETVTGLTTWFRPERARSTVRERFHSGQMVKRASALYMTLLADRV